VVNDLGGSLAGSGGSQSMADGVVAEIEAAGGEAVASYGSVSSYEDANAMIQTAIDTYGRADILVNNAGILRDKTLLKLEEQDWDSVVAVHLKGSFLCGQAFARHAKERADTGDAGGRIINTSSYAGLKGNFGQTNYSAAKAGIYGLTATWALELQRAGVTVNCLAPMAKTRMTKGIEVVTDDMQPEHIAPMALYLASDLAKDVTGRVFGIHGQQLLEYKMLMTDGVTKEGDAFWTAEEIHAALDRIGAERAPVTAPAAGAPMSNAQIIATAFRVMPKVFRPDRAKGWNAVLQFDIQGGTPWTITIQDGVCTTQEGKHGEPTCVVTVDEATYAAVVSGTEKAEKAFMAGKIKASNLGDMMKLGSAFDMKKAAEIAKAQASGASGQEAAAAAPPAGPEALVTRSFELLSDAYKPEAATGWNAVLRFQIDGTDSWTATIQDGACTVTKGEEGEPTCVIRTRLPDYAKIISGELRAEQAFMKGRISASNLKDMMQFGRAFDLKSLKGKLEATASEAAPAAAGGTKMNQALIGKVYAGEPCWARPEHIALFAEATEDKNPAYEGDDPIAPPMYSVRLFKDVLFRAMTDEELRADMLNLVHGEQDMEFFRPLRPMDLCATRSVITAIEPKSTGELLRLEERLYTSGELAVRVRASMFIRDPSKKKPAGETKPAPEPAATPELAFSESVTVAEDQSRRYAEASLDNNPIHTDPEVAKLAGFKGVILHGLCSMALASRAVMNHACGGDPRRLARLSARFNRPVFMGDVLTTEAWKQDAQAGITVYGFRVVNQDGVEVIKGGVAEVRD
jgi:NAD(P)-dependent dehydrogenase (short-subunit alcohol dehydrogenase family)/acyl dehydratase